MDDQRSPRPPAADGSDMPAHEPGDVRQAWGRVTRWLERHAPDVFAGLGGPASPTALRTAEARMGLELHGELRHWLLASDVGTGRRPGPGAPLVALGCAGVLPAGGLLLGLTDIERVHRNRSEPAEWEPSGDPDRPSWRREWVPIAAERDGFHGWFVDTRTGTIGSWREGSFPEEGRFASLFAFFQDVADHLEGVRCGRPRQPAGGRVPAGGPGIDAIRAWARVNGHVVNDRGRVPAAVREAYESSR